MKAIYLLLIVLMTNIVHGQDLTLKLWPEGIPGSKKSPNYSEVTQFTDQNKPRVSRVTDPELLVYFAPKETATGAAVVICPGGGYGVLAIDHEGYDIAKWLNSMGIAGIILKYRLPSDEIMNDKSIGPLQDVQEAIRTVRRNAAQWSLSPNKIGVMGFSAGGHLAGTASTLYREKVYTPKDDVSARPDFSILIYGVLSMQDGITHEGSQRNLLGQNASQEMKDKFSNELRVDASSPPAFLVHSADDTAVPVANSILYYQALTRAGVPGELHIYESGGHGYGLAPNGSSESLWPEACRAWLVGRQLAMGNRR
jgi:acetyl esterase/lipase|nr:MAG: alpha/beta hydrolase [Bacteroidota bacterium]